MKFHLPSFLLGCAMGAAGSALSKRLRPFLLELATVSYRFADTVVTRAAMKREDLQDLLAEARARARGHEKEGLH